MSKREPDFSTEVLEEIANLGNIDGNFHYKHGPPVEKILEILERNYGREDLKPEQMHNGRVEQMYSFIKRAYYLGRRDGLDVAAQRIKNTIWGVDI